MNQQQKGTTMSTPKEYIDLAEKIVDSSDYSSTTSYVLGVKRTLDWLDDHPDQTPGRTITKSEFNKAIEKAEVAPGLVSGTALAAALRLEIAPDPEPTNLDRLRRLRDEWINLPANKATPLPEWLSDRGVKAPEADDE